MLQNKRFTIGISSYAIVNLENYIPSLSDGMSKVAIISRAKSGGKKGEYPKEESINKLESMIIKWSP